MSYEVPAEAVNVEQAPEEVSAEKRELDNNGIPFVKSSNGIAVFGEIGEEQANAMGTNVAAPIKLSEGNEDYGRVHIAERESQLKQNGYSSVEEFVEDVSHNSELLYYPLTTAAYNALFANRIMTRFRFIDLGLYSFFSDR
ncbi:MAG: hypothetical protein LBK18_04045, partial [Prevotellaceae bacterium]|nr:hypothetical protein [Prevotellaceae bacterium]